MTPRLSCPPFPSPGKRIAVVGATGSGKTTIAARLAELLKIPHIELDALHWEENWNIPPLEVFRQRVQEATSAPAWVSDGNYRKARDLIWTRATTLVWLDYSLPVILQRLTFRTLNRVWTKQRLWGNNRETFRDAFLSKDSLFLYVFSSRNKQRASYPEILSRPEYAHLQVIHLRSLRETEEWLKHIRIENT